MQTRKSRSLFFGCVATAALTGLTGSALAAGSLTAAARITQPVDEAGLVAAGNVPRLALAQFDQGLAPDDTRLEHFFVQLRRSPEQQAALESLLADLTNPHSSSYHQWLTAEQLGERFGPAEADINKVTQWLSSHGLTVNVVHKSGTTLDVSGTAKQVSEAFHTQIHRYSVKGVQHVANSSVPQVPAALAPVVVGVVSLSDFHPQPLLARPKQGFTFKCTGCPGGFADTVQYDEGPGDLDTIYNVNPLLKAKHPITGKGQTVVVLEVTDINPADVATFRTAFGLSAYSGTFNIIHPGPGCSDPGTNGAEGEAALDAEWAGAVAPDADVWLASCDNTATNFGAFIAAQNLLDTASPPPIMSLSYLECEAQNGPGYANDGNAFVNALWQQAASEGVSVFVAAGDNAAAGCDNFDVIPTWSTGGIAVNALASTPYNVATGGTDFLDTFLGTNKTYWSKNNKGPKQTSAKSYIPEMPWNDSCASEMLFLYWGYTDGVTFCNTALGQNWLDIIGGSGGPSFVYSKPFWQQNIIGNPDDGVRDLPDVSLFASNAFWNHAILLCMSDASQGGAPCDYTNGNDTFSNSAGGTSFTAPQLASIQALIDQKAGGPQGNPDPIYYDLYRSQFGSAQSPNWKKLDSCDSTLGNKVSSSCLFHDVTAGNNNVPCYGTNNCYVPNPAGFGVLSTSDTSEEIAYPSATGWDFTSGLGTPNVANIVNAWP